MKTAILGCAFYDKVWPKVNFFIRSIKKNSPLTRIILITNELQDFDKKKLTSFDVEFIQIKKFFEEKENHSDLKHFIFCKRYELYQKIFDTIHEPYVLLSDTRDVIFLDNVEKLINKNCDLILSQESTFSSFDTNAINKNWFLKLYNQEKLYNILNKKILCSGVTFGSNVKIKKYINCMVEETKNFNISLIKKVGDQPIHNYLFYSNLFSFDISPAESGPIRSIGVIPEQFLDIDFNKYGDPIVIHQYDRHLNNQYIQKYLNSIFKNFI